jgi:energy-coupling factor transport system permease protein
MLLKNISLGVYYPGNSLLHRLQARTKLILMVIMVVGVLAADRNYWDFTPYAVAGFLVMCGVIFSGISWREMWRRIWLLFALVVLSICIGLFVPVSTSYGARPLYIFPPLLLTPGFITGFILGVGLLVGVYLLLALLPLPALRQPIFRRRLRRARWLVLGLFLLLAFPVMNALFAQPANVSPRLAFMITYNDFWTYSIFFFIFLLLYPCTILLTMTTSPVALIEGLTILLTPLRWLHLPVDDFALMTLLALRFIPTLLEEFEQLIKAQTARGSSFSAGSLRERIQSVIALFVPFLRNTLRRASELSIALEARGYQVEGQQTRLHEKSLRVIDYLVLVLVAGSLLAVLLI